MRVAIIADTHMPRGGRRLAEECLSALGAAELIVHLGDFVQREVLSELESLGPPVEAVHGNVDSPDLRRSLPERRIVAAGGAKLGLVHDAGPAEGRLSRLRRAFPAADAVLFGHSHIPLHEAEDGFHIFNPGSPTERRRAPARSMGIAELDDGRLRLRHLRLP